MGLVQLHHLDQQQTQLHPVETSLQTSPLEIIGFKQMTQAVLSESTAIWMDQLVAVVVTQRKVGG